MEIGIYLDKATGLETGSGFERIGRDSWRKEKRSGYTSPEEYYTEDWHKCGGINTFITSFLILVSLYD